MTTITTRPRAFLALLLASGAFLGSTLAVTDAAQARGMLYPCTYDNTCPPPPPPR